MALELQKFSGLTDEQATALRKLGTTVSLDESAHIIGCSKSAVSRFRRKCGIAKPITRLSRTQREQLVEVYYTQGPQAAQERWPTVCVGSVARRHGKGRSCHHIWTQDQLIEAAKMAGLVSMEQQAIWFRRTKQLKASSITNFWAKKFGYQGGAVHGLCRHQAQVIAGPRCPMWPAAAWTPTGSVYASSSRPRRWIALWVDLKEHIKPDAPPFVRDAICAMAEFQTWLFSGKSVKDAVTQLLLRDSASPFLEWEGRVGHTLYASSNVWRRGGPVPPLAVPRQKGPKARPVIR